METYDAGRKTGFKCEVTLKKQPKSSLADIISKYWTTTQTQREKN